jgi:hypothetical protein
MVERSRYTNVDSCEMCEFKANGHELGGGTFYVAMVFILF